MIPKVSVCTALFLLFFACTSLSQPSTPDSLKDNQDSTLNWVKQTHTSVDEISIWGGYSFDSFQIWGKTPDATLGQLGISYNRKFLQVYNHVIKYTAAVDFYNKYSYPMFVKQRPRNSISGFGISPFGFQVDFFTNNRLQPFLRTAGGLMFLQHPFPDYRGRKTNFTFEAACGISYLLGRHTSLLIGYKFYHMSNGETGEINPGIDSGVLYTGLTFF